MTKRFTTYMLVILKHEKPIKDVTDLVACRLSMMEGVDGSGVTVSLFDGIAGKRAILQAEMNEAERFLSPATENDDLSMQIPMLGTKDVGSSWDGSVIMPGGKSRNFQMETYAAGPYSSEAMREQIAEFFPTTPAEDIKNFHAASQALRDEFMRRFDSTFHELVRANLAVTNPGIGPNEFKPGDFVVGFGAPSPEEKAALMEAIRPAWQRHALSEAWGLADELRTTPLPEKKD